MAEDCEEEWTCASWSDVCVEKISTSEEEDHMANLPFHKGEVMCLLYQLKHADNQSPARQNNSDNSKDDIAAAR
jgi:hypothetical protein